VLLAANLSPHLGAPLGTSIDLQRDPRKRTNLIDDRVFVDKKNQLQDALAAVTKTNHDDYLTLNVPLRFNSITRHPTTRVDPAIDRPTRRCCTA